MALTTLELIYSDAVLKGMNIALDFLTVGGGRLWARPSCWSYSIRSGDMTMASGWLDYRNVTYAVPLDNSGNEYRRLEAHGSCNWVDDTRPT